MPIPNPKIEIRFDGSTWSDVSAWVKLPAGISIQRGRENETDDPMSPGTCTFSLANDDGRFSPDLTTSPNFPYVVPGVAVRVSMWANGAYRLRFFGTVQSWSVSWLNPVGSQSVATVSAVDSLGTSASYTFRQPADEVVRTWPGVVAHWALRDSSSPASPLVGERNLIDNGGEGWSESTTMLAMEDTADGHPLMKSQTGGLMLHAGQLALADEWSVLLVVTSAPTANTTIMSGFRDAITSGAKSLTYSSVMFNGSLVAASYPVVVGVRSSMTYALANFFACDVTGDLNDVSDNVMQDPTKITINPTLSGGAQWGIAHLVLLDHFIEDADIQAYAALLLGGRTPAATSAVTMLQQWSGGPTISGVVDGETSIPQLDSRDAADALGAIVTGMGARIRDNLDDTLTWVPFPPSSTPITLPDGEIDPALTWETTDLGWCSDCTVTFVDGTTYTATRPDGKRASMSLEAVHASTDQDRSYADWLVWSTASTGAARLQQAPYSLVTLSDADAQALCSVTVGARVVLTSLPAQIPSPQLLIVEGIEESIGVDEWTLTFKTSPDVYSRLFILDDPVQGVLDSGYLLAP